VRRGAAPRASTCKETHRTKPSSHSKVLAQRRRARNDSRPQDSARRGGLPCGSAGHRPSTERAGRALATACLKHARPRHARPVQPPEGQGRVSRRRGGALRSLHKKIPGSTAGAPTWYSHGDGRLGSMGGPRAPHGRGAAVLRLEGTQPGKVTQWRTPTPPVQHRAEAKEGKR
jgi:hypothetical protein